METCSSAVERYDAFEKLKNRFYDNSEEISQGKDTSVRNHGEMKNGRATRRHDKKAGSSDFRRKSKDMTPNVIKHGWPMSYYVHFSSAIQIGIAPVIYYLYCLLCRKQNMLVKL